MSTGRSPDRSVWGAIVSLRSDNSAAPLRAVLTDNAGRFRFDGLAGGYYGITVTKPGYVGAAYGSLHNGDLGTPVAIGDAQTIDVAVAIVPGAVLTGRIVDESEAPVAGLEVYALGRKAERGVTRYVRFAGAVTDDRGEYRLFGLAPGEYLLAALTPRIVSSPSVFEDSPRLLVGPAPAGQVTSPSRRGASVGQRAVFFPGTTDPSLAQPITVQGAEARQQLDFALRTSAGAELRGRVALPDSRRLGMAQGTLVASRENPAVAMGDPVVRTFPVGADGRFVVPDLQPGTYALLVRAAVGESSQARATQPQIVPDLWAAGSVQVRTEGFVGLPTLALHRGSTVEGRVFFQSRGAQRIEINGLPIALQSVVAGKTVVPLPPARVDANGAFTFTDVPPSRYALKSSAWDGPAARWQLDTITAGTADLFDTGIEVQAGRDVTGLSLGVTDETTTLSGHVYGRDNNLAPSCFVAIYPAAASLRTSVTQARVPTPYHIATDGTYRFKGLPPGEYLVSVMSNYDPDLWPSPDLLNALARAAVPVRLGAGEARELDLRFAQ